MHNSELNNFYSIDYKKQDDVSVLEKDLLLTTKS